MPGNRVDENCDGIVAPFPRITALVSTNGNSTARTTTFTRLLATGVPAGAEVQVRCSGPKLVCPFTRRLLTVTKGRANGVAQLSRKQRKRRLVLGVGATVEVRITAPAMIGKVRRLSVVKRKFPRGQEFCLAPGAVRPTAC